MSNTQTANRQNKKKNKKQKQKTKKTREHLEISISFKSKFPQRSIPISKAHRATSNT